MSSFIARIPYLLHVQMTALHMFFMEWFILILIKIPLLFLWKFFVVIPVQMAEVSLWLFKPYVNKFGIHFFF